MPEFTIIQQICIWALPVLLAITLHEAAHAYVANKCGDTTAKMFGRLSLNPIRHIDPVGTIILPIVAGLLTNFSFVLGYAKPVPINWSQLRNPKRDMILVTLAGPCSNFLMAFLWAGGLKIATLLHPEASMPALFLLFTSRAGMIINLVLAFLNLIPLPPLDGSKVVSSLLPARQAMMYEKIEPYGFLILVVLIFTGVLGYILLPLINSSIALLGMIFRL
ncbi:site-2 protease family protein [Legionella maioricensis]|uniref:Site-2 protease family protein n=1 Tax=Legionella maioricensis TaxID=2896528 RepID=A0A9X2D372_9GAMM|nr:site-2 protease family protein [Legionella maioricensis]MCL9685618.1 site-2 protease family protein [Legionella maioricensis]MCL9689027.1 site-2 protease family protein [Legionella maioricensis]